MNPLDYVRYATAPYIYSKAYPNLSDGININESMFTDKQHSFSLAAGAVYEFVMISPGHISGGTGVYNGVTFLGKINPTATDTYSNRYGTTQLLNASLSNSYSAKMLVTICTQITSSDNINYEMCRYGKCGNIPDDFDSVKAVIGAYSGTIAPGYTLFLTNHGHLTRKATPYAEWSRNREPPLMVYLTRLTNTGAEAVTVNLLIRGSMVERSFLIDPLPHINSVPIGFALYILEQLRNNNNERLLQIGTEATVMGNIESEITNIVQELMQRWYILLENINSDPNKLINFIAYYLD